jgi:hypothetical protein
MGTLADLLGHLAAAISVPKLKQPQNRWHDRFPPIPAGGGRLNDGTAALAASHPTNPRRAIAPPIWYDGTIARPASRAAEPTSAANIRK